jgi:hypothetical protein
VATIPGGDDLKRNNKNPTTALRTEWVQDESGEMVLWTYHKIARNHSWTVYRNFIVHDLVLGTIATARKEELLREIERQRELGDAGLLEEDKYLAEVNLEGLEDTSGERQHYWLLAIKTTRKAKILREQREQQQADSRITRETGR